MKFYIANPEIDEQIKEIRKIIRLSMNGIVSDQMVEMGIVYKKNFGVSFPRIKEIAKRYPSNHDLSQRLWALGIRETMILATLLEPVDKFRPENARVWIVNFNQIEIVEQTCMNLFSKLPFATSLALECMHSENFWTQVTGYMLAARVADKFNPVEISEVIKIAVAASLSDELHLYKSIGLCLSRICRKDSEIATYILKEIDLFSESSSIGQRYIFNEVKQEILFLDVL
jgi:3-methyladenine DNA glycosylase AlkD